MKKLVNQSLLFVVLVFWIFDQTEAQQTSRSEQLKQFADVSKQFTKKTGALQEVITRLQFELKDVRKADFDNPNEKKARIKEIEDGIRRARSKKMVVFPPLGAIPQIKVGDFGTIERVGTDRDPDPLVFQVIDDQTSIISFRTQKVSKGAVGLGERVRVMVKGVSTEGVVDDAFASHVVTIGLFEVTGTQTYETVAGSSKTILVVEPVSSKECELIQKFAFSKK